MFGAANAVVVVAGSQVVEEAGTASGTVLSGGIEIVSAGGTDVSAQIVGGEQDVFGVANSAIVFAGSQVVEPGGIVSNTLVLSGGTIELLGGSVASALSISSGGTFEIASGYVLSGYNAPDGVTLELGSGGTEVVVSGATDFATQIVGGEQDVFGVANSAIVFAGSQVVETGGIASGTTLSGGSEIVASGGADVGATVLSGGFQVVLSRGTSFNETISTGGTEVISADGVNSGTTVEVGGLLIVEPGGSAIGATINSGGTAELIGSNTADLIPLSGAIIAIGSGAVTVGLGGTSSAVLAGVTISGLQAGDAIDLTDIPFSAGAAAFVSGSDLVISVGVNRYELGLDPSTDLTGDQLRVANDGTGHAEINIAATPQSIAFEPTAADAYLSEVSPFLTGNGPTLKLNLLLLWNVGNGSADAPFQILQYDPATHSFLDDTRICFQGRRFPLSPIRATSPLQTSTAMDQVSSSPSRVLMHRPGQAPRIRCCCPINPDT